MMRWVNHHAQALALTLRRLAAAPWGSAFSIAAMGVALSLPVGGYLLLENLHRLSGQAAGAPQLSLFLATDAGKGDIAQAEARLKQHPEVARYRFVPKEQALAQLKRSAGLGDLAEGLAQNPLPDAFVIHPKSGAPEALERLRAEIAKWPKAEQVQLDSAWARRLDALLRLGRIAVLLLAALLALALATAIFNTIRLQVLTQRAEIEVARLVGATDGFIRRPYLYHGALQGLLAGAAAWLMVSAILAVVNGNLAELGQLYALELRLHYLSARDSGALLALGGGLGWLGAWVSVGRQLKDIEPR